ncbi:MAG: hypothetical protein ABW321_30040 [Polyangiales bacterium]
MRTSTSQTSHRLLALWGLLLAACGSDPQGTDTQQTPATGAPGPQGPQGPLGPQGAGQPGLSAGSTASTPAGRASGGAGASTSGSGNGASGAGGAAPSAGGTSASGSAGTSAASAGDIGNNFVSGDWHGFAWTSAQGMGSTITPMDFSAQTTGMPRCVTGSVAATMDYTGTAQLGLNLNQANATDAAIMTVTPSKAGVVIDVKNNTGSPLRFQVQSADGATNADGRWCVEITGTGGFIPWTSLNTACWDNSGKTYAQEPIASAMLLVPGNTTAAVPFDFCWNSLAEADGPSAGAAGAAAPAAGSGETAAGSGGATAPPSAGAGGGPTSSAGAGKVFSQCRFHFGSIADVARNDPALVAELDFFTPGWMGLQDTFDMQHVCDDTAPGATYEKQIPAIVSYVSAFYAKRAGNLEDCNVDPTRNLCVSGAEIISRDLQKIVGIYENYAQGFAGCYGTTKPIIFMMEPDFFQYTISEQSQPWTPQQAGMIMSQFVGAIKKHLPNAVFSMDISPWVPPNNGSDNGAQWFGNFDMSLFTFVHTSGGHTDGGNAKIRSDNNMTWGGVHQATGKPVLADTGYGVNGRSEGEDPIWNDPTNINARIADGVVSLSQYNPEPGWAGKITAMRAQLGTPKVCP